MAVKKKMVECKVCRVGYRLASGIGVSGHFGVEWHECDEHVFYAARFFLFGVSVDTIARAIGCSIDGANMLIEAGSALHRSPR